MTHGELELEQAAIRKGVVQLLAGETRLKMDVTSFPANEQVVAAYREPLTRFAAALRGGALSVQIANKEAEEPEEPN